jgi:hypothetical protein
MSRPTQEAMQGGRGFSLVWMVIPTVQHMLSLELTEFLAMAVHLQWLWADSHPDTLKTNTMSFYVLGHQHCGPALVLARYRHRAVALLSGRHAHQQQNNTYEDSFD